jgi:flagellar assembly factor FliW
MSLPIDALAAGDVVSVHSTLLGALAIERRDLMEFPVGLYGFPDCRQFALLPASQEGLYWLQSTDYEALTFLLVDPFTRFAGYNVDLSPADLVRIGTSQPHEILVLAIVTLPSDKGAPCTANLQAPVIFNLRDRRAYQLILSTEGFGVREPFSVEVQAA